MKELFSPQEVADVLDIHVKTVRRYLRDGTLNGIKIGGSWKVSKEELEILVDHSIPKSMEEKKDEFIKGDEKTMKSLTVDIKVKNQKEAFVYAQELMKVINSNVYTNCKFNYSMDNKMAKFLLQGSTSYLQAMMETIEKIEKEAS